MTALIEEPSVTIPNLSKREIQVLRAWLLCETKAATAKELYVSQSTVNTHITRIRDKYKEVGRPASTKAALLVRALQDGLIHIDDLG